ncbi:MAG: transglutaminase family protein [bacterium]
MKIIKFQSRGYVKHIAVSLIAILLLTVSIFIETNVPTVQAQYDDSSYGDSYDSYDYSDNNNSNTSDSWSYDNSNSNTSNSSYDSSENTYSDSPNDVSNQEADYSNNGGGYGYEGTSYDSSTDLNSEDNISNGSLENGTSDDNSIQEADYRDDYGYGGTSNNSSDVTANESSEETDNPNSNADYGYGNNPYDSSTDSNSVDNISNSSLENSTSNDSPNDNSDYYNYDAAYGDINTDKKTSDGIVGGSSSENSTSDSSGLSLEKNIEIADKLGLSSFNIKEIAAQKVSLDGVITDAKYSSGEIPHLDSGQVLLDGDIDSNNKRTFYIANENQLPENYILTGVAEINTRKNFVSSIFNEGTYVPVYAVQTKEEAIAGDNKSDANGKFLLTGNTMGVYNSLTNSTNNIVEAGLEVSDPRVPREIKTIADYNSNSKETLASFIDYGQRLESSGTLSQEQKEQQAYEYVNEKIQWENPNAANDANYPMSHTLEQAVQCGHGVCRDKAPALVETLNAAGVPARQVVSDSHTFVAVLNGEGGVDHYLDPMHYETYLPVSRPSVKPNQILPLSISSPATKSTSKKK